MSIRSHINRGIGATRRLGPQKQRRQRSGISMHAHHRVQIEIDEGVGVHK